MKKAKSAVAAAALVLLAAGAARATNYVEQDEFKAWLLNGKKMQIVDIQPAAGYARHHFRGALETNAFPAKTAEEKDRLNPVLPGLLATTDDVVVICPHGGGGAKNAYDYLASKGVAEKRLYILEDGMEDWPYPELVQK